MIRLAVCIVGVLVAAGACTPAIGGIVDFNTLTKAQDPPHAGLTAAIDSPTQATLVAAPSGTVIPAGTDIGYRTVNANTVAEATGGTFFSKAEDFHVAIDFDVSAANSVGLAGIGFGIGEDGLGVDSAGVGLGINNGLPLALAGASRIDDVTQSPLLFSTPASASGRFFVRYDSQSGDIVVGINSTKGSAAPSETQTLAGIQNKWDDEDLLVSFFLRSDSLPPFLSPLSSGKLTATFSNLEVLSGNAVSVPEPHTVLLMSVSCLVLLLTRLRLRRQCPSSVDVV